MAAQFAGSRFLDDRRRRRLAGEGEESAPTAASRSKSNADNTGTATTRNHRSRRKLSKRLPLRRLISPRIWKHCLIAVVMIGVAAGILWAGWEVESIRETCGPAVADLVDLSRGRLLSGFGGLLLLLSSQLSLLIWWVRSRSHTDFSGRYRCWAWAAGIGFVFSCSVSLGLHHIWSKTLIHLLTIDFPRAETLCWLAPALGCASVLFRDLYADMRDCRSSTLFLRIAFIAWATSAVQLLGYGIDLPNGWNVLLVPACTLLGHYSFFMSMLLHARFVTFISAEPPPEQAPIWKRCVSGLGQLLRKQSKSLEQDAEFRASAEPEADNQSKSKHVDLPGNDRPEEKPAGQNPQAAKSTAQSGTTPPRRSGGNADKDVETSASSANDTKRAATVRIDAAHDDDDIPAGLSKRERRRLRKQKRSKARQ